MEAKITWKQKMSFLGQAESGFTVPLGTDPSVGGDNDGFRPMELLALGLIGCTAMDVISILQKKRQEITSFEVQVHAERAQEHPKVFTKAVIEYLIQGRSVDPAAVERAIELSATKYCPAQAMLEKVMQIEHKFSITETL
ncbi:MAG: OsmC family protein [Anaerolineales bacterium]|nr:OsmC family protein [Anaerolineales bacterium]